MKYSCQGKDGGKRNVFDIAMQQTVTDVLLGNLHEKLKFFVITYNNWVIITI